MPTPTFKAAPAAPVAKAAPAGAKHIGRGSEVLAIEAAREAPEIVPGYYQSLGWLIAIKDPHAAYFEWHYLKLLERTLTQQWILIQSGNNDQAARVLYDLFRLLELDIAAQRDVWLMYHSGLVARAYVNQMLWKVCAEECTARQQQGRFRDLSHLVSQKVIDARKQFERPPANKEWELRWDVHKSFVIPEPLVNSFSPVARNMPAGPWMLVRGRRMEPLPPPLCWGRCPAVEEWL
jgi:hypothetical protein